MKNLVLSFFVFCAIITVSGFTAAHANEATEVVPGIPVENTVTLVDLGATSCIPCKMMAPILENLKEEYKGKAAVIFIDVWEKANKEKARAFRVRSIPTQVFFDKNGREAFRHVGFFDRDSIVKKLEELLAQ